MTWKPTSRAPLQFQDSNSDNYSGAVLKFYEDGTTNVLTVASDNGGVDTFTSVALDASGYPVRSAAPVVIYVQEDYKMVLYPDQSSADSDTGAIWTIDNLSATVDETFDSITTAIANVTGHLKIGTQAPGTNGDNVIVIENGTPPEAAVANTVQQFSKDLSAGNTIICYFSEGTPLSGGTTTLGTWAFELNETTQYVMTSQVAGPVQVYQSPGEVAVSASSSSGTLTLDLSLASSFHVSLTENITTITFTNAPASGVDKWVSVEFTQHASTGPYTVAEPSGTIWSGNSAFVMPSGASEKSLVTYRSRDAFSTIWGAVAIDNAS